MGPKRQRKSGDINNVEIGDKRLRQITDDDDFVSHNMSRREQDATMRLNLVEENIDNCKVIHKRSNEANEEDSNDDAFGGFPMVACRTNPQVLVNTIEKMNNIQKKEIIDMGFGHVLSLRVKEVPSMLGYWLLDNFNPITCEISLQGGRKLHIEHNDVYRVFGFPKGKRIIEKKKKQEHHELLNEWKKFFPGKEHKILPVHVAEEALRHIDGGIWFRRQFMVLLTVCLIENGSNGYVTPQIMRCFEDVTQLVEWDWCEFVFRCLVDHKIRWSKNQNNHFAGPNLFIMAFYVDRAVVCGRKVPRDFPTIVNWTYTTLRERQNMELKYGGFGCGYPCEPLRDFISCGKHTCYTEKITQKLHKGKEKLQFKEKEIQSYADIFVSKARKLADAMIELMELVENATPRLLEDENLRRMVEVTQTLIGCKAKTSTPSGNEVLSQYLNTQAEDEFWGNPETIKIIEEIENALIRRNDFVRTMDDIPSFSLGMTQDGWDDVRDVLRDIDELPSDVSLHKDIVQNHTYEDVAAHAKNSCEVGVVAVQTQSRNKSPGRMKKVFAIVEPEAETECRLNEGCNVEKLPIEAFKHQMVRRDKKTIKKGAKFLSPFCSRTVNSSERLTKNQKELGFYMLHAKDANIEDVVFFDNRVELRRRELLTMRQDLFVSSAVIDVWSTILNHNEKLRAPNSPHRFFATTDPTLHTIVDPPRNWDIKKRYAKFHEKLGAEIEQNEGTDLKSIDMFLFTILKAGHFFLISFNLRKNNIHIIDNAIAWSDQISIEHYGSLPSMLRNVFVDFMEKNGHSKRVQKLKKANIDILDLPWVDAENNTDCGIYVMRHMETFKGDYSGKWITGMKRNSKQQMRYMRVKYCAAIVGASSNLLKDNILCEAEEYCRLTYELGPINMEKILLRKSSLDI